MNSLANRGSSHSSEPSEPKTPNAPIGPEKRHVFLFGVIQQLVGGQNFAIFWPDYIY